MTGHCASLALACCLAVPAAAQDADTQEALRYQLTESGLARFTQATRALAGMATREYVVFMRSVLHNGIASWAASQPGGKLPPGASQANVDFIRAHEAELARLKDVGQPGCDDGVADQD